LLLGHMLLRLLLLLILPMGKRMRRCVWAGMCIRIVHAVFMHRILPSCMLVPGHRMCRMIRGMSPLLFVRKRTRHLLWRQRSHLLWRQRSHLLWRQRSHLLWRQWSHLLWRQRNHLLWRQWSHLLWRQWSRLLWRKWSCLLWRQRSHLLWRH
jgi:hypothetical protein